MKAGSRRVASCSSHGSPAMACQVGWSAKGWAGGAPAHHDADGSAGALGRRAAPRRRRALVEHLEELSPTRPGAWVDLGQVEDDGLARVLGDLAHPADVAGVSARARWRARRCPWPASVMASAMPKSSSTAALVPATSTPSAVLWSMVRLVEKPKAPASSASLTTAFISAICASVAWSFSLPRLPMTQPRTAQWGIWVAKSISVGAALEGVHVLGERLPVPAGCLRTGRSRGCLRPPPSPLMIQSRCSALRTGAKPTPQLPMIDRCDSRAIRDGVTRTGPTWPGRRSGCACRPSPG